jgi:hypothetical protein
LDTFSTHRTNQNYYTGRNFGSIDIAWDGGIDSEGTHTINNTVSHLQVNVHDVHGNIVLSTGRHPLSYFGSRMTNQQLRNVVGVSDGHLIPYVKKFTIMIILILVNRYFRRAKNTSVTVSCEKKKKI